MALQFSPSSRSSPRITDLSLCSQAYFVTFRKIFKFPSYVLNIFGYISYVFILSCYCNVFWRCIF